MRAIVPKQGAMKGVQYFISTMSGRRRAIRRPTRSQLSGHTVFTLLRIDRSSGAGVATVWLLPGNSSRGYCTVNVSIQTSCPCRMNVRAMVSMIEARPPRKGCAGPTMQIFISPGRRSYFPAL